jgi:hypothetical protein
MSDSFKQEILHLVSSPGMVPTSVHGPRDLTLNEWVIIEVPRTDAAGESRIDRHIFGHCYETHVYQLSSQIVGETDEYIQTKTRKYFKDGPEFKDNQPKWAMEQLAYFMIRGWGTKFEIVEPIIKRHSNCLLCEDGMNSNNFTILERGTVKEKA